MPEMPEIQAHSERMANALTGATLKQFQLLNFAGLKTFSYTHQKQVSELYVRHHGIAHLDLMCYVSLRQY